MLVLRNVPGAGGKTSMRLEPLFWEGFDKIRQRERLSSRDLLAMIDRLAEESGSLMTRVEAARVYILTYFIDASLDSQQTACVCAVPTIPPATFAPGPRPPG